MKENKNRSWFNWLILILFWPISLTVLIAKKKDWNLKLKILLIVLVWAIPIAFFPKTKPTSQQEPSKSALPQESDQEVPSSLSPNPTEKPSEVSMAVTDKIADLATEKYPNFEVTIWNKNAEFASEGQIPYEVILNGSLKETITSSCDDAKRLSYYMLETFYKDGAIRPTLSRVLITIPHYLRVSLGANDGVPMEQNGSFSGPSNFWTVMERVGLGENENGEMKNRTWGTYLTECK